MLIPIYKSTRTYYEASPNAIEVWATSEVESFEPIPAFRDERFRCIEVVDASAEPSHWVRAPAGTKLLTLEIPGSPVNPLVFAEIPHPKKPGAYLVRELPIGLVIAARNKLYGCELATAPTAAEAAPEIERNVVVVPPASESQSGETPQIDEQTPQVCEPNQGSAARRVCDMDGEAFVVIGEEMDSTFISDAATASEAKPVEAEPEPVIADDQVVEGVMEQLGELVTETVKAEYTEAQQRIDAAIAEAQHKAWLEHKAMAAPAPKAGKRAKVAADQGSLF